MTEYEIRELLLRNGLVYLAGEPDYDSQRHRMIFWQLVALSEGIYRG